MARILDAFSKFFDGNGQPLVGGYAKFFINETTIAADTFDDPEETIVNPVKVPFNADGGLSLNAYGSILMTVKIFDSSDSQVNSEDNVTPRGGLTSGFAYANWLSSVTYVPFISIVTGSDNNYYTPLQTNAGQDPVADFGGAGLFWKRINLNEFFVITQNYNTGARVISPTNLKRYICVSPSLGNDPVSDTTGVRWELDEAILNFAIGRTYAINEKCFDEVDNRFYIAQTSQAGNQPSSDSGTNWLPVDGIVTKPANVLPADLDDDVSRIPVLTGDSYAISGSSAVHKYSRFEVYSDVGLTTLVYKADVFIDDLEAHIVAVPLNRATTYYWRVAYGTDIKNTSLFSDATTFNTVPDLSEIFAINSDAGSAGTRTAITGIDLVTGSGSIWTKNRNTTDFLKRLDTTRNLKELDLSEDTAEVTNVNGLQQYLSNGFEVGTDSGYNGAGDIISSYIFKNFPGFHDTVIYTGNSTVRDIAHSLGMPATAYIFKNISTNIPGNSEFFFKQALMSGIAGLPMKGGGLTSTISNGSTSTTFNVQANARVNATGDTYLCELFADNPNMGVTGGSYTGTGSAGLEITPGFKPGLFITVPANFTVGVKGTHIADIKTGTSSHIYISDTGVGHTEVAGSVASWDNDKIVLDSNAMNESGVTYYYMIIQDPS